MKKYSYLYERENRKQREAMIYKKEKTKELQEIIPEITEKFKTINKIIVFGSFNEKNFNLYSDIDLYMEKITGEEYYIIKRFIEEHLQMDVDLYMQTDENNFIRKIKGRGAILYER